MKKTHLPDREMRLLSVLDRFQVVDLIGSKIPPFSFVKISERYCADFDSAQPHYGEPTAFAHLSYLSVSAFVDGDLKGG